MTIQRRRGEWVTVYPSKVVTNDRGDTSREPDFDDPTDYRVVIIPLRSQRAEVPGQLLTDLVEMIIDSETDTDPWGYVEARGAMWDIEAPPFYHKGTRHTRHKTITLRRRPSR